MIKKQLETERDLNVTQEVRGLAARPASARLLEAARQTPQEVFAAYETTPQGQPRPDIMRALFGRNELARKKADSILKRLFKAFINPFTVVLIVLAVISFITDYVIVEPEDRDLHRRSHRRHHGFHQRHAAVCAGSALGQRGGTFAGDGQDHHCGLA